MTVKQGHVVMARMAEDVGVEIRCSLCHQWWPATDEFYRSSPSRCIACDAEVRRLRDATRQMDMWQPWMSYRELAGIRDSLPARLRTPELRAAVRRAYWRERKREARAA